MKKIHLEIIKKAFVVLCDIIINYLFNINYLNNYFYK